MTATDIPALAGRIRGGDRRAMAQGITLIESTRPDHRADAGLLLENLLKTPGRSIRVGISGVPGVGKSTFIEAFGQHVIGQGHRVAVLAVDPSSKLSGGSILGDKTRMEMLSRNEAAFIRPSPAGGTLGGVARRTREAIIVCEAAGYDVVLVETVGVGQSETAVKDMTDMFLLLLLPGGGDELQGIKKGIVELADAILVNKADGDLADVARHAAADYRSALQFLRAVSSKWQVPVETCSAQTGDGIADAWRMVERFQGIMSKDGGIAAKRARQSRAWLWSEIGDALLESFRADTGVRGELTAVEDQVASGALPPSAGAQRLLQIYQQGNRG